jgi:hypothetical protein
VTGRSAKDYITERLLLEAKRRRTDSAGAKFSPT